MIILLEIVAVLFAMGFLSGCNGCTTWNFSFGVNTFQYPSFELGVSSRYEFTDDGWEVQIVTLGFVVFVIELEFFKPIKGNI